MRFRILTGLLCLGLVAGQPRTAWAGMWDWLEKLSGPGPFTERWAASIDFTCLKGVSALPLSSDDCSKGEAPFLSLTLGAGRAKAERGFPEVQVVSYELSYVYPLVALEKPFPGLKKFHRLVRSLDVGAGAGLFVFDGDGFDAKGRGAFLATLRAYPARLFWSGRKAKLLRAEFSFRGLHTNLDNAALGVPERDTAVEPWSEEWEPNAGWRWVLDLTFLLK